MTTTTQKTPAVFVDEADDAVAARVAELLHTKERVLIAIDGNCCSGKTTSAERLGKRLGASVFHMDDYFLQPHMRTSDRLNRPGGNVDAGRFFLDVLLPVSRGETAHVRRYDCREGVLLPPVAVDPGRVVIVEGAYSLHPLLAPYYDIKLFCRVDTALQIDRIRLRNGEDRLQEFQNRWIPLENAYFNALDIEQSCDIVIKSTQR
ncbi:MAG: uridine kinase [Clostridiales bacterium]|nr:uridine kinase [Clostridiales bacterium]